MKLFPVHSLLWCSLCVLWISQSEAQVDNSDICGNGNLIVDTTYEQNALGQPFVETSGINDTFVCLRYLSNMLNCSWSFHTLEKDAQLSVHISVCNDSRSVHSQKQASVEKVGSASFLFTEFGNSNLIIQLNVPRHDRWTVYASLYDSDRLDYLSPPRNISASVKGKDLMVRWKLPRSRSFFETYCFEYQLDLGDQDDVRVFSGRESFTEPNADPTQTYRVRMRSRISKEECFGCPEWSEWSPVVVVESTYQSLNLVMILVLSLGVPMILLALLLVAHYQGYRQGLFELLFPPIPRPPEKYKVILERQDALNFFYPPAPAKCEEEVTEVEDGEQDPAGTTRT